MPACTDFNAAFRVIAASFAAMESAVTDAAQRSQIDRIATSPDVCPPEKVAMFFEWAYGNRAALSADQRAAAADVGNYAWTNGFYGLGVANRGQLIEQELRGLLPAGATAPDPLPQFVPTAAAPAPQTSAEPATAA